MKTLRSLTLLALIFVLAGCNLPASPTVTPLPGEVTQPPDLPPTLTPFPPADPSAPTQAPEATLAAAGQALFNGDYDQSRRLYTAARYALADPLLQAEALYGLGLTEFEDGNYATALNVLRSLVEQYPDTLSAARGWFLLAETYFILDRYSEAAAAYDAYLARQPGLLDAYVQEWRGDALTAAGDYPGALSAYELALSAPRIGDRTGLEIKHAQARANVGDYANAIALYDQIAALSPSDTVKAQMDYLAGLAHLEIGQTDQAYQRFLHGVETYPLSDYSYLGLVILVDDDIPVSDLYRGMVDFHAGQYLLGLAALDRYIAANPANDGTAHYYRALTLRALGNSQAAVDEFSYFLDRFKENPYWMAAWRDKAYTQWAYLEQYNDAANTLVSFVNDLPQSGESPALLLEAGRIQERGGDLALAAATWTRLADQYPASGLVPQALFWAGISHYRLGDLPSALTAFQRSLLLSGTAEDQARAYLWIGKVLQAQGDPAGAVSAWQTALSLDPTGYYSERARDLLMGNSVFEPPVIYSPTIDLEAERAEAAAWLRVTFGLAPETDLSGPGPLANDARMRRASELIALGEYALARQEVESLRIEVGNSAVDSFRLANALLDMGLYRPAIFAGRQVLTLAGLNDQASTLRAPRYFNHLRYGLYYQELVAPAAEANGFHPLFLFSVIRQESLYEGFAGSSAGARGLMQIIPSTGASLAENLGWPLDYVDSDLERPLVSITLGTRYLASSRNYLDGNLYAALAGYNAGPGNARIWLDLSGPDPDLFLEVIRFEETRNYIRYIYEIHTIYRLLYSPTG